MTQSKKSSWTMFLILATLAATISVSSADSKKIRIGTSPVTSSSGIFIAQEKGYFKEQGLDTEVVIFRNSGAPMTVPLAGGEIEIGGGNLTSGLYSAIAKGVKLKLVADKGSLIQNHDYITLLVRSDHLQSGRFKSLKDLKGFKMGQTAQSGVSQEIIAERFLTQAGLKADEVTFVKMSYPEMNAGLQSKAIDATVQLEPYSTHAELDGFARKAASAFDVYPGQQSAAIIYSPSFAENRKEDGVKFMIAYLKGVRDYENAFVHGKDRPAIIAMLRKYIDITSDKVWEKMPPSGINPDGRLNLDSLKKDQEWYARKKYIEKPLPAEQIVDHSFVDEALKRIGTYKKP